jgi:hypothetical protein
MGQKVTTTLPPVLDRTLLRQLAWSEDGCVYQTTLRFLGPATFTQTKWSETWVDEASGNVSEPLPGTLHLHAITRRLQLLGRDQTSAVLALERTLYSGPTRILFLGTLGADSLRAVTEYLPAVLAALVVRLLGGDQGPWTLQIGRARFTALP